MSTPSICLHSLRLTGTEEALPTDWSELSHGAEVLASLSSSVKAQRVYGADLITPTRFGIRFRPKPALPAMRTYADEAHTDQSLALLLELGLPLDHPIEVRGETHRIRELIADTIAMFNLEEPELEWTAVALALALPPARSWRNRFGVKSSFDDLVSSLCERRLDLLSCGGTHVLYAMAILAAVHAEVPMLSPAAAQRLHFRLEEMQALLVANQSSDGSFGPHWFRSAKDPARRHRARATLDERILLTGHIGECLLWIAADRRNPQLRITDLGRFLWKHLRRLPARKDQQAYLLSQFCPLSHAAVVVRQLRTGTRAEVPRGTQSVPRTK